MFAMLFRLAGIDLDTRIARIKQDLDDFAGRKTHQVKHELADIGISAALVFAGGVAMMGACAVLLLALYVWIDWYNGPLVALAAIGLILAVAAAILLAIAAFRGKSPPTFATTRPTAVPTAMPASLTAETPLPKLNLASVMPPLTGNSLLDQLSHRVSMHAAGATDDALSAATTLVSKGSRSAVLGTIALTAVIGVVIGRYRKS